MNRASVIRSGVFLMIALSVAACGKRGDLLPPPGKQTPLPIWELEGPTPPAPRSDQPVPDSPEIPGGTRPPAIPETPQPPPSPANMPGN